MRISDWSSDVCSSDLGGGVDQHDAAVGGGGGEHAFLGEGDGAIEELLAADALLHAVAAQQPGRRGPAEQAARGRHPHPVLGVHRSEEHTSELQSLMRISYAVFCLKKKKNNTYH